MKQKFWPCCKNPISDSEVFPAIEEKVFKKWKQGEIGLNEYYRTIELLDKQRKQIFNYIKNEKKEMLGFLKKNKNTKGSCNGWVVLTIKEFKEFKSLFFSNKNLLETMQQKVKSK